MLSLRSRQTFVSAPPDSAPSLIHAEIVAFSIKSTTSTASTLLLILRHQTRCDLDQADRHRVQALTQSAILRGVFAMLRLQAAIAVWQPQRHKSSTRLPIAHSAEVLSSTLQVSSLPLHSNHVTFRKGTGNPDLLWCDECTGQEEADEVSEGPSSNTTFCITANAVHQMPCAACQDSSAPPRPMHVLMHR